MKYLKSFLLISVVLFLSLSLTSIKMTNADEIVKVVQIPLDTIKWVAPDTANDLINPFESNDENIAKGLVTYKKSCRYCHGRNGDGQGFEAEELETVTTDFTDASYLNQSDGSMYWKISEGRNDMESFENELTEEEIWLVILYTKTFSVVAEE